MPVAATTPRLALSPRGALTTAALILLGTGAWFAASWIDKGDSTCGAVVYPGTWLDESVRNSCQGIMAIRTTITAAILAAGGALLYVAARRRPMTPARATTLLAIAVATSAAILVVNERVRSGGAF